MNKFLNVTYDGDLNIQPLLVKKEMNRQWEKQAETIYFVGLLAGLAITVSAIIAYLNVEFDYVSFGFTGIGIAISANLARQSNKNSYYLFFISAAVFFTGFTVLPYSNGTIFLLAIAATVLIVVDAVFNIIAVRNFETYTLLTEEPGFPEFTPLSEMRAIELAKQKKFEKERRVLLNNPEEAEFEYKVTEKDIKRREYQDQISRNVAANNKFTYPGKIFIYNKNIADTTFSDKNKMMFSWNNFVNTACKMLKIYLFFQIVTSMFAMMDGGVGIVYIVFALLNLYATSSMKSNEKKGFYIYLISWIVSLLAFYPISALCGSIVGKILLAINVLVGIIPVIPVVRCVLNFKLLTALSKEPGYPSFIRNTADEFGSQMYILEEPKAVKLNDENQNFIKPSGAIYMDVGYEKPKEPGGEKAWNAFDYRDSDDSGMLAEKISNSVFTGEVVEEKENSNEENSD